MPPPGVLELTLVVVVAGADDRDGPARWAASARRRWASASALAAFWASRLCAFWRWRLVRDSGARLGEDGVVLVLVLVG